MPRVLMVVVVTAVAWGCRYGTSPRVPEPQPSHAVSRVPKSAEVEPVRQQELTGEATTLSQDAELPLPDEFEPDLEARAWSYIVLHHSATGEGSVESIDADHRSRVDDEGRPWLGIGYHFVVGNGRGMPDGLVEPTFRWEQQLAGAHAGRQRFNERGIGICLIGNFDETAPTSRQTDAVCRLVWQLAERFNIPPENVLRHNEVSATRCPGTRFPWDRITRAATRRRPAHQANPVK